MNKVVYVKAGFKPVGRTKIVNIKTGEKTKGIFGEKDVVRQEERWENTGFSKREIDGKRLAWDIEAAVGSLNTEGYEVVSVVMVTSGDYAWNTVDARNGGVLGAYGYGYSYTEGAIITAKKIT
ncbi:hypothetical protein [Vibrio scophthalmi]|uniref:Uncharacterized protein n=1 Tax=Vibrio scophthalmi TaxID=45658 RepID=A0A1C7FG17_9VIBR|nr:hypothetical protein [Vibrio scophthalmi]ANU38708.1 hypothetical protein VSVS05_03671 [Vibrio scophthalmi]